MNGGFILKSLQAEISQLFKRPLRGPL